MATALSICNTALILVGDNQINSFDDSSRAARLCSALYETTKDFMLQKSIWSFTLQQTTLAKTVNTPLFDYTYEFQIPSNSLRIIKIDALAQDYRVHQDKIFANTDPLSMLHQIDPGEENYPAYFTRALELKLAELLASALMQDSKYSSLMAEKYIFAIREARAIDAQMDPNPVIADIEFALISARGNDG